MLNRWLVSIESAATFRAATLEMATNDVRPAVPNPIVTTAIAPAIASSRRARMAQTCFGKSGLFRPMIRPLFQALRFGVVVGSWTLGMICPPFRPPRPVISTALMAKT